ncbi:MAG: thiamine pyrophosphate-dependent enzyme [Patescibacteria group bacterium]|nr:thiamine pyrophosphate-dependent enzyme [Patescibacteria group bacterium]
MMKLDTNCKNTWCPGCGDFGILNAFKKAVLELEKKGVKRDKIAIVSGIGCSSKIVDYLNLNSFCSLHGRPIASAQGIKLGNPELKVIVFMGDGGCYNEGIAHLIHAAKRNTDITVLVHNNRNFALTTGQFTATSPKGFKGASAPQGSIEEPFNPLRLMMASKASFIARGYSAKEDHLKDLIIKGVEHNGFSFIDILQPCITFFNTYEFYNQRVYEMKNSQLDTESKIMKKIEEWGYDDKGSKIPIGIFRKQKKPVYETEFFQKSKKHNLKKVEDLI